MEKELSHVFLQGYYMPPFTNVLQLHDFQNGTVPRRGHPFPDRFRRALPDALAGVGEVDPLMRVLAEKGTNFPPISAMRAAFIG